MNIKPISHNANYIKSYEDNKRVSEKKSIEPKKDSVEISDVAKSLRVISNDDIDGLFDEKRVENIKTKVKNGTYKVDSRILADKMLRIMKGREV